MPLPLLYFQRVLNHNGDIKFINTYKGVPISYPGKVVEVGVASVRFNIHPNQILCIRAEGFSHISNPDLPVIVKGTYLSSDFSGQTVLMTSFEGSHDTIGARNLIRVNPREAVELIISIQSGKEHEIRTVRGTLVDISIRGAALFLNMSLINLPSISRGDSADVVLFLPDNQQQELQVSLKGIVRNISQTFMGKKAVRIGLQTYPDRSAETALARYVAQRQNDILKEIREKVELELRY